jgi:hypothetical protein
MTLMYSNIGHVLCAMCCVSIIDSSQTSTLCPFCRNPYTRDGVRVIRIESSNSSNTPLEDSVIESSSSTPSGLPAGLGSTGPYPTHGANCDFCGEQIRGSRYVSRHSTVNPYKSDFVLFVRNVHNVQTLIHVPGASRMSPSTFS